MLLLHIVVGAGDESDMPAVLLEGVESIEAFDITGVLDVAADVFRAAKIEEVVEGIVHLLQTVFVGGDEDEDGFLVVEARLDGVEALAVDALYAGDGEEGVGVYLLDVAHHFAGVTLAHDADEHLALRLCPPALAIKHCDTETVTPA